MIIKCFHFKPQYTSLSLFQNTACWQKLLNATTSTAPPVRRLQKVESHLSVFKLLSQCCWPFSCTTYSLNSTLFLWLFFDSSSSTHHIILYLSIFSTVFAVLQLLCNVFCSLIAVKCVILYDHFMWYKSFILHSAFVMFASSFIFSHFMTFPEKCIQLFLQEKK